MELSSDEEGNETWPMSTERTTPKPSIRWMASPTAMTLFTATAAMTRSGASAATTLSTAALAPMDSTADQGPIRRATGTPPPASLRAWRRKRGPAATRKATPTSASRIFPALISRTRSAATKATTNWAEGPATTSSTAGTVPTCCRADRTTTSSKAAAVPTGSAVDRGSIRPLTMSHPRA